MERTTYPRVVTLASSTVVDQTLIIKDNWVLSQKMIWEQFSQKIWIDESFLIEDISLFKNPKRLTRSGHVSRWLT